MILSTNRKYTNNDQPFLLYLSFSFVIASLFFFASSSLAQSNTIPQNTRIISQINIRGVNFIEKGILYAKIKSEIGEEISQRTVSNDIKAIYSLGYFRDVKVVLDTNQDKIILNFILQEKPRIRKLSIQGNTILTKKTLEEKLQVHVYNMVNRKLIEEDIKILRKEYREKGYFRTQVSYQLTKVNHNTFNLTYIIKEASQVYLTDINITGTNYFYPIDIKRSIQSAEIDCFAWITKSGVYHEEKINTDLQIITQLYLMQGFIKVKIDKPQIKLFINKEYSKIHVNLNIKEGDQFFTGKVDVTSDDQWPLLLPKEKILEDLTLKTGDVFNPFKQQRDQFLINDIYLARGYVFSKVRAQNVIHEDTKTVDIIYHVVRKEKVYIGRVEILGNHETRDYVVRRELEIHDNELYNGVKLRKSQSLLLLYLLLNYFVEQ